mmetsp:Transcript_5514/g.9227  ORF Transcript_5514/g.9227 Transcript_5514/m.9227 type:complete len:203 (+) Transcript_5514:937-1545(+)
MNSARNSSNTDSWTSIRFAQTQVWPEFRNLLARAPIAAALISASSKTMKGAFPPSSKDNLFTVSAQSAASLFPTNVDPVKLSFRTASDSHRTLPTPGVFARDDVTTCSTPGINPASSATLAIAMADNGVSSAGFTTIVHPAARAGASFLVIIAEGKFQGVTAAQTPTGCFIVIRRLEETLLGMTLPYARLPSSANHLKNAAA